MSRLKLAKWLPRPGDDGLWGRPEVAKAAGVNLQTIDRWRWLDNKAIEGGLQRGVDWVPYLPAPDDSGRPRWLPEHIVRHLMQTARMTPDQEPEEVRVRSGGLPGVPISSNLTRGQGGRLQRHPDPVEDAPPGPPRRREPTTLAVNPQLRERDQAILLLMQADERGWLVYEWVQARREEQGGDVFAVLTRAGPGRRTHTRPLRLHTGEVKPLVLGMAAERGEPELVLYRDGLLAEVGES